ncbi:hypothetical protein [Streptomyces canus]|uniref:FXSXX-COOH protein n=1 Tax=Streptomyces canus TaxID=58343 RepID=A0AAW8F5E8_9ACTN|nr:hypothetical protein [Streptomyces canus]MDQ0767236.1 hypothetical protein [Streptomyces canus]MDQ0904713.1 hypothetical protein [Streptomyces canus]
MKALKIAATDTRRAVQATPLSSGPHIAAASRTNRLFDQGQRPTIAATSGRA